MKTAAIAKLRHSLVAGKTIHGLWVTLESPSITEMAVALGLDWIVVDAEHGHLDWKEIVEHIRATVRSDTVALVRIAELNAGAIKRALDIGADGVVVPWVESADQLKAARRFALYPPEGVRGIGAERATCWGQCFVEHTAEANEHVLIVPIIETVRAGQNIASLLNVPGIELFFFGPADFSSTAGHRGLWEGPGVAEQILKVKDAIRSSGKHCGVVARDAEELALRQTQGFRMLAIGLDSGLLLRGMRSMLGGKKGSVQITAALVPERESESTSRIPPLLEPPESMRPDRDEVMNAVGSGPTMEIAAGVTFECLVGAHNQARSLTTGLVTFAPGANLPYHVHAFAEAVTLLGGQLIVEIEGRIYNLNELDNIAIPRGIAHTVINRSRSEPAKAHVAMASDRPTRTLVNRFFSKRAMPDMPNTGSSDSPERLTRYRTAERFQAGPGTSFIDFYNADLIPGFEMSGGYGLFDHSGRLPAHVHDFDESITIIAGRATCIVEGRRYAQENYSTALQPRGRVHYFVNESREPMSMLWVYAGPLPQRIVVDERCATSEGNPWR